MPRRPQRAPGGDAESIWRAGKEGEDRVAAALGGVLVDDWTMFRGYRNPGGEIDQVLVGPSGVVAIEVKYVNGKAHIEGDRWTLDRYDNYGNLVERGVPMTDGGGRSPSAQLNAAASRLEWFLSQQSAGAGAGVAGGDSVARQIRARQSVQAVGGLRADADGRSAAWTQERDAEPTAVLQSGRRGARRAADRARPSLSRQRARRRTDAPQTAARGAAAIIADDDNGNGGSERVQPDHLLAVAVGAAIGFILGLGVRGGRAGKPRLGSAAGRRRGSGVFPRDRGRRGGLRHRLSDCVGADEGRRVGGRRSRRWGVRPRARRRRSADCPPSPNPLNPGRAPPGRVDISLNGTIIAPPSPISTPPFPLSAPPFPLSAPLFPLSAPSFPAFCPVIPAKAGIQRVGNGVRAPPPSPRFRTRMRRRRRRRSRLKRPLTQISRLLVEKKDLRPSAVI